MVEKLRKVFGRAVRKGNPLEGGKNRHILVVHCFNEQVMEAFENARRWFLEEAVLQVSVDRSFLGAASLGGGSDGGAAARFTWAVF